MKKYLLLSALWIVIDVIAFFDTPHNVGAIVFASIFGLLLSLLTLWYFTSPQSPLLEKYEAKQSLYNTPLPIDHNDGLRYRLGIYKEALEYFERIIVNVGFCHFVLHRYNIKILSTSDFFLRFPEFLELTTKDPEDHHHYWNTAEERCEAFRKAIDIIEKQFEKDGCNNN